MNDFVRKVLTVWRTLEAPFDGAKIIIAVSGGADSVGLAAALGELIKLKKLRPEFIIGHFNHGLRGDESDQDAVFVRELAKTLRFRFIGGRYSSPEPLGSCGGNLEENARIARYRFLEDAAVSLGADWVATGHTQNDQAETFLLRLLRGSGSDGLGAMRSISFLPCPRSKTRLLRPLLSWAKRDDTEGYLGSIGISFREDPMNKEVRFSRVRVRHELIPLLKTFNPNIIGSISQAAELLQTDSDELNREARELLSSASIPGSAQISLRILVNSAKSVRRRALRLWICENNSTLRRITFKHLEAVENLMFSRKSGREIKLPSGNIIVKTAGKLIFKKSKVEKSPPAN